VWVCGSEHVVVDARMAEEFNRGRHASHNNK